MGTYTYLLKCVISNDLERVSKKLNDTKHRAASLRQLSLLYRTRIFKLLQMSVGKRRVLISVLTYLLPSILQT